MHYKCNKCGKQYGYLPVFCPGCGTRGTKTSFTAVDKTEATLKDLMAANPKIRQEVIDLCEKAQRQYAFATISQQPYSEVEFQEHFKQWIKTNLS